VKNEFDWYETLTECGSHLCALLQTHRITHHIHALEHLWELPEESVGFLRDASVILEAHANIQTGDLERGAGR